MGACPFLLLLNTHICWLGINEANAPSIMMFTGNTVERISTDGIDYLLDSLIRPEQSTAMMYRVDGHLFYHLTFYYKNEDRPDLSDNLSLIYDIYNKKFYHISDQNLNYHPARQIVYFNQDLFFISINNGCIYKLSTDLTFINEDIEDTIDSPNGIFETDPNLKYEMQRIRIPQSIRFPTSTPFTTNQFVFTLEQGCDNIEGIQECLILMITEDDIRMFSENGGPGNYGIQLVPERHGQEDCESVPYKARIDLALSRDGGETFGNYVARYLNPIGYRKNILRWNKLGFANDLTLKIRFWGLGRFVSNDGLADVVA